MNWFTADKHFGHHNILKHCNRPFKTHTEMEDEIIRKNNEVVAEDDVVWDLGDHAFRCSAYHAAQCLRRMNGRRIILWGNHDKPLRKALKQGLLQDLLESKKLTLIGSPSPDMETSFTTTIERQKVVLSHCAKRTWYLAFRGSWHLFGHSHSNLAPLYKSMDVGVDTNSFYPYSFTDIKNIMEKRTKEFSES